MTALAKLESALRGCVEHMEHSTPQGRAAYEQALAALSPAELGGVEKEKPAATVSVVMGRMGEIAPHCVILSNEYEAWLDNQPFGTVHRLYTNPRAAEAEWLPIESAPKDGTAILAFWAPRPDHPYFQTVDGGNYAVAEFREYEWRPSGDDEDTTCWANPTHWRPLPAPPSLTPPSAKGEL